MTREEAISVLNDYDINFERHTPEEVAEAHEMAIEALEQQKTGHWTHDGGYWKNRWICSECGYKLYDEQSRFCPDCGSYNGGARGDIPLQQNVPEMPQPTERTKERTETHACESKADKALNLLAEWAIECGFGFDNIPEEYEKYKDDIEDMGYREGLVYIVKKESEAKE